MTIERVIEIPWALMQLPQSGVILDVGSCEALYLQFIAQSGRHLHCLDPRDCPEIPKDAVFHNINLIENSLPRQSYDAVLMLSTLEHVGMPYYGQPPFPNGDVIALEEVWQLLKPDAPLIVTVPAGSSKLTSWYRQYSPTDLYRLFANWDHSVVFWGFDGKRYEQIQPEDVENHNYRDRHDSCAGAGALAGIIARRPLATYR